MGHKVMLRDIIPGDLERLDEIHQRCHTFAVPRLNHIVDDKVVTSEKGDIIGYGILKLFPEAIMILDTDLPLRDRIAALHEFLERAMTIARENGSEQIHAFVQDEKFSHLLIERYGFRTVSAKPLVLNLE
jgi:hypothetical protein